MADKKARGGSSRMFKSEMCSPKPRDTEAGRVSTDKMQFEEFRKAGPSMCSAGGQASSSQEYSLR